MRWLLVFGIILIIAGILGLVIFNFYYFSPSKPGIVRNPFRGPNFSFRSGPFASNGEQIFFTGTSSRGTITTTGGPFWFQMHDGGCASCHGSDGRGGRVVMMGSFTAPSIVYDVLTGKADKEEDHKPYTDELIKQAITKGIEPDGERLSNNMPRWDMSEEDLNDVVNYLKTLKP